MSIIEEMVCPKPIAITSCQKVGICALKGFKNNGGRIPTRAAVKVKWGMEGKTLGL
ncbi:hypothetical protein [Caldanaerobacter sp.]|uniref:hypothetical protein n=1 Tax=Caldanaerobacter sp. TaxID=2930036 RepID=UPI00258E3016|nr:hypothetical protein [Caldanaerobacter sp.]